MQMMDAIKKNTPATRIKPRYKSVGRRVCGAVGRREPYNLTLENKTYYTQNDDSMR